MAILLVIALYAAWSSVFSLAKVALQYSPPIYLTGFRMVLAGVLLLAYLAIKRRSEFQLKLKQLFSLSLLAIFSIYLTNILEFWGLQYLTAGKACFIYSLSPFFAALFSYLHFGEKMNGRKLMGLLIGFVGILPVVYLKTGGEETLGGVGLFSWPTLAIIGAALCSVYGWVLLRLIIKDQMVSPVMANGWSMVVGGAMALVHSFFSENWNPLPVASQNFAPFFLWTGMIAIVSNLICYNLYGVLLKRFTATFLSFMGLLSPIFASLHGWIFLGEPLSWVIFASTALVSLGLWVVYAAELRQGYTTTPSKEQITT